jgi:hypothetical protein
MEALHGLGAAGIFVFLLIFSLLFILLPFSAYAAQKWANRTYKESVITNQKLDEIIDLLRKA